MSAFSKPFLFADGSAPVPLERLNLGSGATASFSGKWLQEALFAYPESLPVKDIDPHIGALIPVCMEIETGAGPADILYVTGTGQVVLVETKLWRNPEARREVVAQILDYAKQLTTWTYDVLDQQAALAAGGNRDYLLNCLRKHQPDADESVFADGIVSSLKTGDFLLLLVGDGIRKDAKSLVAFLERYGNLRFKLGLIEVAAFRMPDGKTLLQPRILAKTEILERTILLGPAGPVTFQEAAQSEDADTANTSQREWFMTLWQEYLEALRLDDDAQKVAEPAKASNQYFAMPPGAGKAWVSAYIAQATGIGGVYLTFAKTLERGTEIYELLESDRDAIEHELGAPLSWERKGNKVFIGAPNVTYSDLNLPSERACVITHLVDMTQRMIKVFRPRLTALANSVI